MTVQTGFWPRAWRLKDAATSGHIDATTAVDLRDESLLEYLLSWQKFAEPSLIEPLVRTQSFSQPPSEMSYWALLEYLRRVAPVAPDQVGQAVSLIRTSDPRIVADAISVALLLPEATRQPLVLSLTDQWLASGAEYFDAHLWSQVRQSIESTDPQRYSDVLAELMAAAASLGASDYELQQFAGALFVENSADASATLAAVEGGLASVLLMSVSFSKGLTLAELQTQTENDAIALLSSTWLRGLEKTVPRATRAARLIASSEPVLQQLGLRELGRVLAANPSPAVLALFENVAAAKTDMQWSTEDEFLRLLSSHFEMLRPEIQSQLVEHALSLSPGGPRRDAYRARNLLSSVREHLGPREKETLRKLVAEYGPYEPRQPTRVEATWVTPEGPLPLEQMRALTLRDVLALMVWAPSQSDATPWGGSPLEGLAAQVTTLASERPNDYLQLIQTEGAQIPHLSLHAAVVDGIAAAAKSGVAGIDYSSYISWMGHSLSQDGQSTEDDESTQFRRAICRGLLSLAEILAPRNMPSPGLRDEVAEHAAALADAIATALNDPDPTPEAEAAWESKDLLTISLNVNRGIAARAAYTLLAAESQSDFEELTQALIRRAIEETSAAVQSVTGAHLGLIRGLPDDRLWRVAQRVMRFDSYEWAAVFDGYITSHRPSELDEELFKFYERAVESHADATMPWLAAHWESVLVHLAVAFLSEQPERWTRVLNQALEVASPSQAAQMYRTLGSSFRRNGTDMEAGRLVELAGFAAGLARRGGTADVASAAAAMLVLGQVPLGSAGGALLDLTRLGADIESTSMLALLERDAASTPGISVALLQAMFSAQYPRWRMSRDADSLNTVLGTLADDQANTAQVRALVDELGANGLFAVEPAATALHSGDNAKE